MKKLLIANRGEIAVRIIRTARELGIHTVVVASEPDVDGLAARLRTNTRVIGPAPASQSYLDQGAVLESGSGLRLRRRAPRLRVPVRERRVRPGGH